ncbi:pilus assembly FimT family protein [Anaerosacchariphilus polymeriproducens]|nr:prepilin-type N-terminal cleavage/methylation domain-containing protein [Anaerosacchariphilus polymeriproducens]
MKDNRGYSLIELVVTLAIIVIVGSGAYIGIGLLSGADAKKCASKLDSGLKLTKTVCLSKENGQLEFSRDASGDYYMEISGYAKEKIGKSSLTILYTTGSGASATESTMTNGTSIKFSFKRGSGIFNSIGTDALGQPVFCSKISITQNSTTKTIVLIPETGKHYIE